VVEVMTQFFEIDFLEAGDRGSGDAIALRYRNDGGQEFIHVVDGGYTADGQKIVEHVKKYYGNATHINHVVLTHPDGDHSAGLKTVLQGCAIGTLWMNRPWVHVGELLPRFHHKYTEQGLVRRLKKNFPNTAELEAIAAEEGITIRPVFQGDRIGAFDVLAPSPIRYLDCVVESEKTPEPERAANIAGKIFERVTTVLRSFSALWGEENLKGDSEGTSAENESSVVQFANLCNQKILLTGDAGIQALDEAYQYLLQTGVDLPGIDRFQVPHHGSRRNLSSDMLDAWLGQKLPQRSSSKKFTAIISANHNDGAHPKKAVVRALIHRGAGVYQTKGTLHTFANAPSRSWSAAEELEYPEDMEE